MNKASGSACGKVILAGEHMVLYGASAIAVPTLSHRTHVLFEPSGVLSVASPTMGLLPFVEAVLPTITTVLGVPFPLGRFTVQLGLPAGSGGGMSASLVVALSRAIAAANSVSCTPAQLTCITNKTEEHAHGRASGLDAQVIIYEMPVYVRSFEAKLLPEMPVSPLVLLHSGRPEASTAEMVQRVSKHLLGQESLTKKLVSQTNTLVEQVLSGADLVPVFQEAQSILEAIGVVPETVVYGVQRLRHAGYTAKITGAGGIERGGIVLVTGSGDGALANHAQDLGWRVL